MSASSLPNTFIELGIWNRFKVQVLLHIKKEHCLPNFTVILFDVDVKFYIVTDMFLILILIIFILIIFMCVSVCM